MHSSSLLFIYFSYPPSSSGVTKWTSFSLFISLKNLIILSTSSGSTSSCPHEHLYPRIRKPLNSISSTFSNSLPQTPQFNKIPVLSSSLPTQPQIPLRRPYSTHTAQVPIFSMVLHGHDDGGPITLPPSLFDTLLLVLDLRPIVKGLLDLAHGDIISVHVRVCSTTPVKINGPSEPGPSEH